jgi:hypothetical protein
MPKYIDYDIINKRFDYHELPVAFFSENPDSNLLRKELIKNQVRINTDSQDSLEDIFFSKENIYKINQLLRYNIYIKSDKKFYIPNQSEQKLIIVMRYIFLEYARHLPFNINKQIEELNNHVVSELLPSIMTNITQKIDYLKFISEPHKPISLPVNTRDTKHILPPTL